MTGKQEQGTPHDQLVEQGFQKIRWAEMHQRLLQRLREQFSETNPFTGLTIGICLHVEPKTAVLCSVLQAGGAKVVITGSPGTTKNDVAAALKHDMENEHGVGPTIVEGFMRETNLLVQSRSFVVFGYGSVGRGIARCLRRLGGQVTVVELDAIRALEAVLDGMRVTTLEEALSIGEVFFTATGRPGVIAGDSFDHLPDGAILANAGHFSWEIDIAELRQRATAMERLREWVEIFTLEDGRRITLLAQGEMLNLAGGGGNPIETMDLGLALQAQSLAYLVAHHRDLPPGPQPVPAEINATIARWMVEHLSRRRST